MFADILNINRLAAFWLPRAVKQTAHEGRRRGFSKPYELSEYLQRDIGLIDGRGHLHHMR